MKKEQLIAAAVSGMMLGLGSVAHAASPAPSGNKIAPGHHAKQVDDKKADDKHACKGKNACKGKGGCKTDKHACKGQNACKGQGGCATDGSMH